MSYYVYFLTNIHDTVLYIGMTGDIQRRLHEHKNKAYKSSFSAGYNLCKLVYIELFDTPSDALSREKQLKRWRRSKKNWLINTHNPSWRDLSSLL